MPFVKVAGDGEIAPGSGKVVTLGGREYAVFHIRGSYYCMDNECPHAGGPLGEGMVDGESVMCPWHGWCFDISTGEGLYGLGIGIRTYSCKLDDGGVWVDI